MPDDCAVVPEPIVSRSSSSTSLAPSVDRWNATDVPTTPPPITITSKVSTALPGPPRLKVHGDTADPNHTHSADRHHSGNPDQTCAESEPCRRDCKHAR